MLLWEEHLEANPGGYSYSQFCVLYRRWKKKLKPSLRQAHRAGDKLFVDYAGQTVPIVDARTGEVKPAQIFVAVLGASNYTFAEATGRRISSHGPVRICAPLTSLAAYPGRWCPTT